MASASAQGSCFPQIYNMHWTEQVECKVSMAEAKRRELVLELNTSVIRMFHERGAIHTREKRSKVIQLILKYNVNDR